MTNHARPWLAMAGHGWTWPWPGQMASLGRPWPWPETYSGTCIFAIQVYLGTTIAGPGWPLPTGLGQPLMNMARYGWQWRTINGRSQP